MTSLWILLEALALGIGLGMLYSWWQRTRGYRKDGF